MYNNKKHLYLTPNTQGYRHMMMCNQQGIFSKAQVTSYPNNKALDYSNALYLNYSR
jgi:hypothetical protein